LRKIASSKFVAACGGGGGTINSFGGWPDGRWGFDAQPDRSARHRATPESINLGSVRICSSLRTRSVSTLRFKLRFQILNLRLKFSTDLLLRPMYPKGYD
jgi:hypothetical protein